MPGAFLCIQVNSILQIAVAAARTRLQGTAEAGDAKACCDEEHAGNDDNPPRVYEQGLFADRNALRFVFAANVFFRGGNGVVARKASRADAETVHHFRQTL